MVQHSVKKKVTLPKGAKPKTKKGPIRKLKKGKITITPKKPSAVQQAKISTEVTRVINNKNEQQIKGRANKDVNRIQ